MQFNFLFVGSDGRRYIGTAGHCILGESPVGGDVDEESWAPGTGGVDASLISITRLQPQVNRAQQVLGLGFTLQTAAQL